ncbi:MAG: hypothetical protein JXR36_04100 [Bacteroidales bacterium]|nr:hypothetical protein [Bacteroidales bacterium]
MKTIILYQSTFEIKVLFLEEEEIFIERVFIDGVEYDIDFIHEFCNELWNEIISFINERDEDFDIYLQDF